MDNFVYNIVTNYFDVLGKTGYVSQKKQSEIMVLFFYYNLLYNDYRTLLPKEDYRLIRKALYCLYGVNCLIPYPNYKKMGCTNLGNMAEVLYRLKKVEEGSDLKPIEETKVIKGKNNIKEIADIDLSDFDEIDD